MAGSETLISQIVSHYRIVERRGFGGMRLIYQAEDTALDRFVALKFLPDDSGKDPQVFERFRREAIATSSLNHPNICTIYEIGDHDGRRCIAMEYLEGKMLKQMISRRPPELERMLTAANDVALPNEAAKDDDRQKSNSRQHDLSESRPGTPAADAAIKAGVASY
jgi:eukaryotic-like serine/threonine-protein kinase